MKRAASALLFLLCAVSAWARVISYAPYSDRISVPAFQARTNRHFVLMELSTPSTINYLPVYNPTENGQLVVYDSRGLEEPRVVFPPDGTQAQIYVAAAREDDSQLALLVQSTFDGGMNPQHKMAWFLSIDGGVTWKKTALPDDIWAPYTSTTPYWYYYDMGGPFVRSSLSAARIGTQDTPFVVSVNAVPATASGIYSLSRNGTVKLLAPGASALLLGENVSRTRFLASFKPRIISIVELTGNTTDVGSASDNPVDGWIGPDGSAYAVAGYSPSTRNLRRFVNGTATSFNVARGGNSGYVAVPPADYNGAWIAERLTGMPTTLSRYSPETNTVTQWSDVSGPEVEALHPAPSGNSVLIQVHRPRNLTEATAFKDPALAVWHLGDPAPARYDELYLNEQASKGFVHLDVDAIANGTPFVFDSGAQVPFGCIVCSPPVISAPPPTSGGSDVVQEWGVVRASLTQKLVLPGIGRTQGAFGSYWLSDVTFYNPLDTAQRVTVRYVPTGDGPTTAAIEEKTLTLGAREIRLVPDALKTLFDLNTGGGAFFITPESGVSVSSRTYSQSAAGTYGFGMNALDLYAATGARFALTFSGAFFGADTRTNLILTDTSGRGTAASLQAASSSGAVTSGTSELAFAPANGQQQINGIGPRVGLLPYEAGGLIVQPKAGEVIASVIAIDNRTNDPTYFPPDLPATVARTIPAIGHIDGANNSKFRSDLFLFNPASTPSTVTLQINPWDGTPGATLNLTLLAFEARVVRDGLMAIFGRTGIARLRYQSTNSTGSTASVRVTSRTYSLNADGGTYGFLMPPLNSFQSAGPGDALEILGTTTDGSTRTNLGLVDLRANTATTQAHATIAFYDKSGAKLDELTVAIPGNAGMQLNDIYRSRNLSPSLGPALIRVTVVDGLIGAYAASVDNGTNDSTYLPANLAAK